MGKNWQWFHDTFEDGEVHLHAIKAFLANFDTKFQHIDVVETLNFGKMLIIDGDVQSSIKDEYIYHESLTHPALLTHPSPKKVFILGGGEGATLREVVKHKVLEKILMVDIDEEAVEICKKLLPEWSKEAYQDKRVELKFEDGRTYLEKLPDKEFDILISDVTEPFEGSPSVKIFSIEFFKLVYKKLKEDGLLVLQSSILRITNYKMHKAIRDTLRKVFPIVRSYYSYVPAFDTTWSYIIASKVYDPKNMAQDEINKRIEERIAGELYFYDGETHSQLFFLPKDIRKILESASEKIISDKEPFSLAPKGA